MRLLLLSLTKAVNNNSSPQQQRHSHHTPGGHLLLHMIFYIGRPKIHLNQQRIFFTMVHVLRIEQMQPVRLLSMSVRPLPPAADCTEQQIPVWGHGQQPPLLFRRGDVRLHISLLFANLKMLLSICCVSLLKSVSCEPKRKSLLNLKDLFEFKIWMSVSCTMQSVGGSKCCRRTSSVCAPVRSLSFARWCLPWGYHHDNSFKPKNWSLFEPELPFFQDDELFRQIYKRTAAPSATFTVVSASVSVWVCVMESVGLCWATLSIGPCCNYTTGRLARAHKGRSYPTSCFACEPTVLPALALMTPQTPKLENVSKQRVGFLLCRM